MQLEEHTVTHTANRYRSFRYELILEGIMVGTLAGAMVVVFRYFTDSAGILLSMTLDYGRSHTWSVPIQILTLAVAACVISLLLKWGSPIPGSGTPQIEGETIGETNEKWWCVLLTRLNGGIISLGCGLSLGCEGPSTQLGATMAKESSRATRRVRTKKKFPTICGASAGLSTTFNAPITDVLSAPEGVHKRFSSELPFSSMAASAASDFVSRNVFGLAPVSSFHTAHMMSLGTYGHILVLDVIIGVMGVVHNTTLFKTQNLYGGTPWGTVEFLIPLLLAGVFRFTYRSVLGRGRALVEELSMGEMTLGALCLLSAAESAFGMISLGFGAPGGVFLPLLVMGAIIGSIYYNVALPVSPSLNGLVGNFVILGMAGCFSATVQTPITNIIPISEMTRSLSHSLTLPMVSLAAYLVPDMVHCVSVYDQLLYRLLAKQSSDRKVMLTGKKMSVEDIICHGSTAEERKVSTTVRPRIPLVVSLMRGEAESMSRGDIVLGVGDKIIILCGGTLQG